MPDERQEYVRDPSALRKATSIKAYEPTLGQQLYEFLTGGMFSEEPGPVDLLAGVAGLGGGAKLAKGAYRHLVSGPNPTAIASDIYGLSEKPMGRRAFLYRASGAPEKAAKARTGQSAAVLKDVAQQLGEPISPAAKNKLLGKLENEASMLDVLHERYGVLNQNLAEQRMPKLYRRWNWKDRNRLWESVLDRLGFKEKEVGWSVPGGEEKWRLAQNAMDEEIMPYDLEVGQPYVSAHFPGQGDSQSGLSETISDALEGLTQTQARKSQGAMARISRTQPRQGEWIEPLSPEQQAQIAPHEKTHEVAEKRARQWWKEYAAERERIKAQWPDPIDQALALDEANADPRSKYHRLGNIANKYSNRSSKAHQARYSLERDFVEANRRKGAVADDPVAFVKEAIEEYSRDLPKERPHMATWTGGTPGPGYIGGSEARLREKIGRIGGPYREIAEGLMEAAIQPGKVVQTTERAVADRVLSEIEARTGLPIRKTQAVTSAAKKVADDVNPENIVNQLIATIKNRFGVK